MKLGLRTTLDRAVDLLLAFDESHPRLSVEDLAARLDRPKSTVYRYVRILQEKGLLVRGAGGQYALGVTVLRLARTMRRGNTLIARAGGLMQELAERLQETIVLTKMEGADVVCLDRVESSHGLRISFEPGAILPPHASAPSKVVLAHAGEAVLQEVLAAGLPRFTPSTITKPDDLRAELETIRRQGYAVSRSELDLGTVGLAVPVRGPSGRVVAGLGAATPEARTSLDELLTMTPVMQRAAERLGAELAD